MPSAPHNGHEMVFGRPALLQRQSVALHHEIWEYNQSTDYTQASSLHDVQNALHTFRWLSVTGAAKLLQGLFDWLKRIEPGAPWSGLSRCRACTPSMVCIAIVWLCLVDRHQYHNSLLRLGGLADNMRVA